MILRELSPRGGLGPETHSTLDKLALPSSTMDRLRGFMHSKNSMLKDRVSGIFSEEIIKKWSPKEIHYPLMTLTEALRGISSVQNSTLTIKCKIRLLEAKSKSMTSMAAIMSATFPMPVQKTAHKSFLISIRTLKRCTSRRKICPLFKSLARLQPFAITNR
jgi:hypothetical protein